jgi:uncharacterized protein
MISSEQISSIVEILVGRCKPDKITLFGSYAQGTEQEDSDLDIAIVKQTDLPKYKRPIEFQRALRANGQRWLFPMDILVFTPEEMEENQYNQYSIVYEILTTGKTLYESTRSKQLVYQG